ncbi:MAG: hypothetical protein ACT4N9_03925 [Paracoccaceae bacterium]
MNRDLDNGIRTLGVGRHSFLIVTAKTSDQFGKPYMKYFHSYDNPLGRVPGVETGGSFFAAILSGDQTGNYESQTFGANILFKLTDQASDIASFKAFLTDEGRTELSPELSDTLANETGHENSDLEKAILDAFDSYDDSAPYQALPSLMPGEGYNSNGFAATVAVRAGSINYPRGVLGMPGRDPGTRSPLPASYFDRWYDFGGRR